MTVVVRCNSSLDFLFRNLTICGIWKPPSFLGTRRERLYKVYSVIMVFITLILFVLTQLAEIYINFGDIDNNVDSLLVTGSIVIAVIKSSNIILRRARIQQIRDTLDSEMFTVVSVENKILMHKYMVAVRYIFWIHLTLSFASCTLWAAFPIFDKSYKEMRLPLRAWFPGYETVWVTYVSFYTYQVIGILIIALINSSQDCLINSFAILFCGQLDMLCGDLVRLGQIPRDTEKLDEVDHCSPVDVAPETRNNHDMKVELKNCILHQKEIIKCIKEYQNIISGPVFLQLIISCLTICVTAFQMSVTKFSVEFLSQFAYFFTMLFQVFIYCYPGHEITVKSQLIATAVYQCPWYDQDMEFKKMMITLMESAKRPLTLTVGLIFPLKLETLTSILQSSCSYYIVLRRMHSKNIDN